MKVGDIITVDGKKVRVTWVQGNNYSYAPVKEESKKPVKKKGA